MSDKKPSFVSGWSRAGLVATILFLGVTFLIAEFDDRITMTKEVFYSWLLVFFNAYIGTFIANQALKKGSTGFYVWGFLINGIRAGLFLVLLLIGAKWFVVHARGFVLITFFGYFIFLAAEVYGLQAYTKRIAKDPQCR